MTIGAKGQSKLSQAIFLVVILFSLHLKFSQANLFSDILQHDSSKDSSTISTSTYNKLQREYEALEAKYKDLENKLKLECSSEIQLLKDHHGAEKRELEEKNYDILFQLDEEKSLAKEKERQIHEDMARRAAEDLDIIATRFLSQTKKRIIDEADKKATIVANAMERCKYMENVLKDADDISEARRALKLQL